MMLQIWLVWTLVWAVVGANLLAFLMSVTSKEVAGTQFSIYMTLINVGAFAGNALSPVLLDVAGGSFPTCSCLVRPSRHLCLLSCSRSKTRTACQLPPRTSGRASEFTRIGVRILRALNGP